MKDSDRWIFTRTTWTHDHCRIRGGAVRSVGPVRGIRRHSGRPPDRADGVASPVPRGCGCVRWIRRVARASIRSGGRACRPSDRTASTADRPSGRPMGQLSDRSAGQDARGRPIGQPSKTRAVVQSLGRPRRGWPSDWTAAPAPTSVARARPRSYNVYTSFF